MTNESRVCVLLVLFCAAQAGILTGSDFFCRDPDTGKLHATNTTWASTTFCGNYTCKLRKKNITATEYAPFRQINVTKINFFSKNLEKQPKNADVTDKKIDNNLQEDKDNSNFYLDTESEDDRYLTEKEIKTISEILHLMKKSDLDAIIEIYKLAQDIYKEIDTNGLENVVAEAGDYRDRDIEEKETVQRINSDDVNAFNVRAHSYWNGPAFTNTRRGDMDTQGTNIITSVSQPKKTESYFIGPLISTDFKKLPYYYPVSSFQRISSYTRPRPTLNMPYNKSPSKQKIQKDIRPSLYLPYPFSYVHNYYNSSYPSSYYRNNFNKYDVYSRNKLPYMKSYVAHVPNAVLMNPHLTDGRIENAEAKPVEKGTKEVLKAIFKSNKEDIPDWQTSPLAIDVLEEVRAREKAKILRPYRKNIKLERVGKLIKLEELPRQKREAIKKKESKRDLELYEVFLDKTTCSSNDTVPGYFRYGNLSHPFPECCPQRIGIR